MDLDFQDLKKLIDGPYLEASHRRRQRNWYYYQDVLRLLKYSIANDSSILQLSLDDGWFLNELKPKKGVLLTVSPAAVERARKLYPELTVHEDTDFDSLPAEEKFDYLLLTNTIGSVTDLQPYFERLNAAAKPSTRLIITYYNYLWEPVIKLAERLGIKQPQPIQNWLSTHDISHLLDLAGFEVIKKGKRLLLPIYIPFLSVFFNRVVAKLPFIDRLAFWNYVVARAKPVTVADQDYRVSVVVPVRNEKGNIESAVKRLPMMGKDTELIFVEGNSTDNTWEEIQRVAELYKNKLTIKFVKQEGRGKGDAVRKGFSIATGDILMILDADLTVPPEDLPRFYKVIASNQAEYVHGSRLVYPMEEGAMRFLNLLGNKFFSAVFSWLLKQRVKDTLCGTKVLFKSDYERLAANRHYFGDFDPFGDFDLIFGATKLSLKIREIPVHYKERTYGTTNISRFRHGLLLLRMSFLAARKLE